MIVPHWIFKMEFTDVILGTRKEILDILLILNPKIKKEIKLG